MTYLGGRGVLGDRRKLCVSSWHIPFLVYFKIISIKIRMCLTIRKPQDIFLETEKVKK